MTPPDKPGETEVQPPSHGKGRDPAWGFGRRGEAEGDQTLGAESLLTRCPEGASLAGTEPFREADDPGATYGGTIDPEATEAAPSNLSGSRPRGPLAGPAGDRLRIGDYEILRPIARGGMGYVYEAVHIRMPQPVALKMLRAGEYASEADIQRFLVEARAVAKLHKHPNIIKIYNISEDGRELYFAMQLVRGGSLKERLAEFGAQPRKAAELMARVAGAVGYAHRKGILHRDLKPENILVDEQGIPYVTDFGLARRVETGPTRVTPRATTAPAPGPSPEAGAGNDRAEGGGQETIGPGHSVTMGPLEDLESSELEGMILGTPSYMPPEQALGRLKDVTTLSDVYGLGATLYAILAGRPPFQASTVREVLDRVIRDEPEPLRQINPRVDRDLEAICSRSLRKDAKDRYESAEAFARDLQRWLHNEPVHARHARWWERLGKWVRREPFRATLAASAIAATALVGAISLHEYRSRLTLAESRLREVESLRKKRVSDQNLVKAGGIVRKLVDALEAEEGNVAFEGVRQEMLTQALAFFELMIEQWSDDEENRLPLARACTNLAKDARSRGRNEKVRVAYEKAIASLTQEIQALPASQSDRLAEARRLLAECFHERGIFLNEIGRPDEARRDYLAGREIRKQLCWCEPHRSFLCGDAGTPQDRADLGRSYGYLGDLDRTAGENKAAEESYTTSHQIRESLYKAVQDDPELGPRATLQLSRSFGNLAWLARHNGDLTNAIRNEQEAANLLRERLDHLTRSPGKPLDRSSPREHLELLEDLAFVLRQVAEFQRESGREAEALASLDQSLAEFDRLIKIKPGKLDYAVGKASTESVRAAALLAQSRPAEAANAANLSLGLLGSSEALKDDVDYQRAKGQAQDVLGRVALLQDRPADALAHLQAARETLRPLVAGAERNYDHASEHAEILADLARALAANARADDARDLIQQAIAEQAAARKTAPLVKLLDQRLARAQDLRKAIP